MAAALLKYETLESSQIDEIMAGKTPTPPRDWEEPSVPSGGPGVPTPEPVIGPPASQT
jgi:cell division protease FtsH